jgi:hypothetical protein
LDGLSDLAAMTTGNATGDESPHTWCGKIAPRSSTDASLTHAGAKYLGLLMTKRCAAAHVRGNDRSLLAPARYNAGAGDIARMRTNAVKRGIAPDEWLNSVEPDRREDIVRGGAALCGPW